MPAMSSTVPETIDSDPSPNPSGLHFSACDSDQRSRKGKRGRPSIDPSQGGLAERRRAQVRKAQRAHRIRKEEAAALLARRMGFLENQIEQMRQLFLQLMTSINGSGLLQMQPHLTYQFHNITRDFLSASQAIDLSTGPQRASGRTAVPPNCSRTANDQDELNKGVDAEGLDAEGLNAEDSSAAMSFEPIPFFASSSATPTYLVGVQAEPPNFAQRLYLRCIRRAYHLLTSLATDHADVVHVFQYSFQHSDITTMIQAFDNLLRNNGDYRTAYVYGIGGAGTHYSRTQTATGLIRYVPSGQPTFTKTHEDVWFDPRDIEGWLEDHGLVIGGESFMYLSDFCFFDSSRARTLVPGTKVKDGGQAALILDVEKFLQQLLLRGVCLGESPGFRRIDVEEAFNLALSDDTTFSCGSLYENCT